MIPMETRSSRHGARARLYHAWIIVSCDLLTKATHRQRRVFVKSADWLEATIESVTIQYGDSAEQQEKARATGKAYRELQREVETFYAGGKHMREDVENLKVKFAAFLDLCGIKDADIPIFDEPDCNRQSLITSFGTMSKKSPMSRPKRKEPVLSDPSVYGEQLLDYLMAQTDSDTSLSRPDDSVTSTDGATDPELQNNNEEMHTLDSSRQHSSCPSQAVHDELTPAIQTGGNQTHEQQNIVSPPEVGGNGGKQTPSHCTTDSCVVESTHSNVAEALCQQSVEDDYCQLEAEFSQQSLEDDFSQQSLETEFSQQSLEDDFNQQSVEADSFVPQIQNRTSGSTPELPATESSTCLDILYASMFDSIEDPDSVKFPINGATAAAHCPSSSHSQNSPVHQEVHELSDRERYSCTTTPGTTDCTVCHTPGTTDCTVCHTPGTTDCTVCHTPRRSLSCEEHSAAEVSYDTPVAPSRSQLKSHPDHRRSCFKSFDFCEPLVVNLPPEPRHKSALDQHSVNMDRQHKPCQPYLVDVEQCLESHGPPLPPRRPMTDRKIRTGQPICVEVNTERHGIKSYYSEKKVRRYSQQTACDVLPHPCWQSQQIVHCEQCIPGNTFSPRHRSAQSRHRLQDVLEVSMVSSPPGHSKEQSRNPQTSLARSASKRRRGNDNLPVQNSHQDRPVRPARQRLQFLSPSRSNDTTSDCGCKQAFPVICPSEFDQAVQPKRVQTHVCRMLKQEHKPYSPQQCSKSCRKPATEQYNIQVRGSDMPSASNKPPIAHPPNHEEGLQNRNTYYSDFTLDRCIECCPSSKKRFSASNKENESQHSLAHEISVRKVEGSECPPSLVLFKVPPTNMRAPRTADQRSSRSKVSSKGVSTGSKVFSGGPPEGFHSSKMTSCRSDSSSLDYPNTSSSSDSYRQTNTRSSLSSRSSSKSSKVSTRKSNKYTSHPMASSTLIFDSSFSYPVSEPQASPRKKLVPSPHRLNIDSSYCNLIREPQASPRKDSMPNPQRLNIDSSYCNPVSEPHASPREDTMPSPHRLNIVSPERGTIPSLDTESVITWTINDDFPDYLDGSRSQIADRSMRVNKRQSVHIDTVNVISEIVQKMPLTVSDSREIAVRSGSAAQPAPVSLDNTSGKHILASSKSSLKAADSSSNQKCSDPDNQTCRSLRRNNAQAVLVCKGSDLSGCIPVSQVKHISASEPDLRYCCPQDEEEAEFSLVPSDTDSTPDSLPRNSSTSSSSCTAARCRPRIVTRQLAEEPYLLEGYNSVPDQDLMDSILTDSPRSVNSSGIYAPYNSYTSPVSFGSPNGHSTTISSSLSADTNQAMPHEYPIVPPPPPYNKSLTEMADPLSVPPPPPYNKSLTDRNTPDRADSPSVPLPPLYNTSLTDRNTPDRADPSSENKECLRPFTPLPHVNQIGSRLTRNQGVTAEAPSIPHGPQAVIEASSMVPAVVPQPVVTPGPRKIKDKNSLVRKLKQFGSHFTRKPDKIQTLANL